MEYKSFILDNGAKLGIVCLPGSFSITFSAYLPAGFRHDPPNKPGLAHFVEHMLLSGTKKYPTSKDLSEATSFLGGWQSAFTWIDYQVHTVKLPRDYLKQAIDVLLETIANPLIREDDLVKERNIIKEEILRNKVDPEKAVWDYAWNLAFWYGTGLARPYSGSPQEVDAIEGKDVKEFVKRQIEPQKAVYLVAGDFDYKKVYQLINKVFGQYKGKKISSELVQPSSGGKVVVVDSQNDTSQLMFGFKTVSASHKDVPVLDIISDLLGGSYASKLIDRLREEGGLIYNWEMWQDLLKDSGYIFFKSATKNSQLEKVLKILCEEFVKLRKKKIGEKEFNLAKQQAIGSFFVSTETTDDFCDFFGFQEFLAGKAYEPHQRIDIYKKITKSDIQEVAKKYFTNDNWYLGVVGRGEEKKLRSIIESKLA